MRTRRLDLGPLRRKDFERLYEHWCIPEVGRWLWDQVPPTREQVEKELVNSLTSFAERGFGVWLLRARVDSRFVGTCGLLSVPEGTGEIEIICSIEPCQWRRGYALEATRAVLRHAFEELEVGEIVGRCDVPNEPSRRLVEKLGMRFERKAPIEGVDCFHYRLTRTQYRGSSSNGAESS